MVRKALLCGINAYSSAPLQGCVNDARAVQGLLLGPYGFPSEQVRLLLDGDCVKSRLMQEWRWLTQGAEAGDVLVFHFSGHGSYVPDLNGDEEDLRDEITCLQNFAFDDAETYITDDAWYAMAQAVDPRVHLLLIKDTCHSGGSSRFIGVRQANGLEKIILADQRQLQGYRAGDLIPEHALSNARFLVPPQVPAESWQRPGSVRRAARRRSAVIHTSLMACGETQTAADAYLDGAYAGAFTHHLCAVLRDGTATSSERLISEIVDRMRGHFEQVPQHEGRSFDLTLFCGANQQNRPLVPASVASLPAAGSADATALQGLNAQQLLSLAHLRYLDTMRGLPTEGGSDPRQPRTLPRVLVAVHGIGNHAHGYSDAWWTALQPHVGSLFNPATIGAGRAEVFWSDLVNQQRSADAVVMDPETQRLRQAILDVLEDRRLQQSSDPQRLIAEGTSARGIGFSIDDFLVYMVNPAMRRRILERFTRVVRPLLASGTQLDLLSHSWGTVVAYEGLRELEQEADLVGRVRNWFTVGSALSLPPVQASLRPENRPSSARPAPRPALVTSWINLDAKGDLVGGPLGHRFAVSHEVLQLEPTGCAVTWAGTDLGCAHGSYFQPANIKVNRDIFAAHMLDRA